MKILKKSLIIIGLIGILLFFAGALFNISILSMFSDTGSFRSEWTLAEIHLIHIYLMVVGAVLALGSLSVKLFQKRDTSKWHFIVIGMAGIAIIILAVILSPSFVEDNYTSVKYLTDSHLDVVRYLQLIMITFGSIIVLVSFLLFNKRSIIGRERYGWIISLAVLIIFVILVYSTFIRFKYPQNIITEPAKYSKLVDLLLGNDILLSDFQPRSNLIVEREYIAKAKYPVIDMNFHLRSEYQTEKDRQVLEPANLVKAMDSVNVRIIVNTDGFWPNLDRYPKQFPSRYIIFYPTWFPPRIMTNEELSELPGNLERAVEKGARGDGEIWKYLGARTRDEKGKVLPVDDPRLDPLWDKAGELGIPILWHMIDVPANFQPIDKYNERYVMLSRYPEFSFYDPGRIPSRETMMKGRENVLRKHPNTIFIGCHMGMNANDLAYCAYMLDTYPNYYLEISTVVSELGRQPVTARKFFIKYQDRILFGTDGGSLFGVDGWTVEKFYQAYFEFLETDNEYIKYPMQGAIDQGDWRVYGINLPDSALKKIYYKNAEKILKIDIDNFPRK